MAARRVPDEVDDRGEPERDETDDREEVDDREEPERDETDDREDAEREVLDEDPV